MSNKEPWLAISLSAIFPGIGQIYSGKLSKGLLLIIGYLFFCSVGLFLVLISDRYTLIGIFILIFAFVFIYIGSLFDSYRIVQHGNSKEFEYSRTKNKDPWRAVFFSDLLLGLGHLYLGKKTVGIGILFCLVLSYFFPVGQVFVFLVTPLIIFHAYQVAPVKRESDRRIILIFVIASAIIAPFLSLLIAFGIRGFVAESRFIPAGSMEPTLQINDRLIIDKISYRFSVPQRGDIIVFNPTEMLSRRFSNAFIKRIIGLPGDTVELRGGQVLINRQVLNEPYVANEKSTFTDSCIYSGFDNPYLESRKIIPPNHYLVLGDNRDNSLDSRCWGLVPRSKIIGKANKRFWPLNRFGALN